MIARRTAIRIAAVIGAATAAAVVAGRVLAPAPRKLATPPLAAEPEAVGAATARWVVDLGPGLTAPDRVVHAPIVVGDRLLVAASRIGFAALDVATGAVAWRRPASPDLAAPRRAPRVGRPDPDGRRRDHDGPRARSGAAVHDLFLLSLCRFWT